MKEPKQNVLLADYTTLHIGGVADYVWEVETLEEVRAACRFAKQTGTPPLILGGGSNLLISDEGYRGVAILMRTKGVMYSEGVEGTVVVQADVGTDWDDLVRETTEKGLWGLENLSAIPGTVGATPVQNVGAYGVEVSSLIESVSAIHSETGEEKIFSNNDCQFSYRDSYFKTEAGKYWVITSVTFVLHTTSNPQLAYADLAPLRSEAAPTPAMVRSMIESVRANKFPDWSEVGTAGSFFKNPIITKEHYYDLQKIDENLPGFAQENGLYKVPLGYILDKVCGLKGYVKGSVALYEKQALVLVANQGATATEVKNFVEDIKEVVLQKTNIKVECEVRFV